MSLLVFLALILLAIPTLCFAIEIFAGLKVIHVSLPRPPANPRGVIVVPAHDEAMLLKARLAALKAAASPTPILLVADNCSDATAAIGREMGVEVIERFDEGRRGKGFALDFARRHLTKQAPDVVLIVDADCSIDAASVRSLLAHCSATGVPCQATNLQKPQRDASPAIQLSTFAFFVKNVIRQRALFRLAGRAQLLGTGMALPWRLFERADLATSSIVEDIRLGHELAEAGNAPILVEEAVVWSDAETASNTLAQRQRWEGGFLNEAFRQGPSRLRRAAATRDVPGVWAALSIMVPPFALLVAADLAALALAGLTVWAFGGEPLVLLVLGMPLLLAALGLILAWRAGGWRYVSLEALIRSPLYLVWKVPMYARFLWRGTPQHWRRTDRTRG